MNTWEQEMILRRKSIDDLFKAEKDVSKLTKKVVTVSRGGKTFQQTVYVKQGEEDKKQEAPVGEELSPDVKGMKIIKYSDKSLLISGDTYVNVDTLRSIKKEVGVGSFNAKLKGWIFPIKFLDTILGHIWSDLKDKGEDDKADAVQNQKNASLEKGDTTNIQGVEGKVEENVSDSKGTKYNVTLGDGTKLENVDEKVMSKEPENDDKKISDAINNASPENRVKTEKKLYGLKPITDLHNYSLPELMSMHGLTQEDIDKVISAFKTPKTKDEASKRVSTGGTKKEYTKKDQSEGLTKRQLIGKLVYQHYQAVKSAIEAGKEIKPEALELYAELQDAYSKKRQAMSEETKRKISEALKKDKVEDKGDYKPKEGRDFFISSPKNTVQREPVKIQSKDYTDVPALDVKIPKQKDILDKEKPYFIPNINDDQFRRNGYTLPAVKVGDDQYLVALNGFTGRQTYQFSLEAINKNGDFAIMSLDIYAATQKYYQLKAKEELKQKELKRHQDRIDLAKKALSELDKIDDPTKRENTKRYLESHLEYYEKKRPKQSRLKMYDKPDKMAQDQMFMIQAFNRNEEGNFVSRQEGWRIYRDELFADRQQKQIDLDLQAEHDASTFTKGRETSFGDSGTKDDLLGDYGVKVKRQNGDEINDKEIAQIKEAMDNTAQVFGKNIQMNKEFGLKISHSGNVKMHASKASGFFFPYYKAIGVSREYGGDMFNFIFAHEYSHFMDNWVGSKTGNNYASDKQGSTANEIARTFRKNMNKFQKSDYQNRTCECFARSLEMYAAVETKGENATVWDREKYFDAENYVNKNVYETQLKPLIKKFLEENKEILKSIQNDFGSTLFDL